jgi:hypothetical protein
MAFEYFESVSLPLSDRLLRQMRRGLAAGLHGRAPRAGKGVRAALLGTIKRRDGRSQVTYAGRPLYFYSHEDPGIVLCHNVNLNGGYWWAIGADGQRRPA